MKFHRSHPCQKDRDEISPWEEKKKGKHFIPRLIFFFIFDECIHICFPKHLFEHNESMNIIKHKASLKKLKSEKKRDENNK